MPRDLFNRYVWLVDTIRSYGRITRRALDELWVKSPFSAGDPLPRRTFHSYRQAAEELFNIEIKCDPTTFEYYIVEEGGGGSNVTDWLLNTAAAHKALSEARDVASHIIVDDVPSARQYLAPVIEAIREHRRIRFDYHPYHRTLATRGIVQEPYVLKCFKQRWYAIGLNTAEKRIKTYALDRMSSLTITNDTFAEPDFDAAEYFRNAFGIVVDEQAKVTTVRLQVELKQAKYFRALPLHHTQTEFVHDKYSIFEYRLRITGDFVAELLSYGPRVTVLEPRQLRTTIASELQSALDKYTNS